MRLKIVPIKDFDVNEINILVELSVGEGFNFLNRLREDWLNGVNRFDKENERLYLLKIEEEIVGVGGINHCPYVENKRVGRIRRVYIHPDYRRKGFGKKLMSVLIDEFKSVYEKIVLRTDNKESSKFYESIGFVRIKNSIVNTHELSDNHNK